MQYKTWLEKWLDCCVKIKNKEQTYKKYRKIAEKFFIPELGEYDMNDITYSDLQKFISGLSEKGLAPGTVNLYISILKASVRQAVIAGASDRDCTANVVRPKKLERKIECFSRQEQQKLEHYVISSNKRARFGILLCLYTGLRIGELLALTWSDIDLQKGTVSITKTCFDSWENGHYVKLLDTPKSNSSVRVIPLPNQIKPYLKELQKNSKCRFIVQGKSEYGAQIRSYQRTFEKVLTELEIPHRGFHSLRHTFATRALECGMDIKTLSEILGHSDPTLTLKRYSHSMLEHKIEMMNRVGKLLK